MSHADPWGDGPPGAGDLWLVHGSMGTIMAGIDPSGGGRYVLLRIGSRRNHHDTQDDRTYALGLEETASIVSGLISLGNLAFGRAALTEAMATELGMTQDDRREAAAEAARRLAEDTP